MIQGSILHSVSYSGSWGQHFLTVEQFVDKAADLGYDGVMLMAKRPHLSVLDWGAGQRSRLRERLEGRAARTAARAMRLVFTLVGVAVIAGCATPPPSGPSVMVLPGSSKSFDQFRFDDNECRQFASSQIGGTTAAQAQTDSAVKSAVVGTAIGAAAGGLMGGNSGAGVGAGIGLAGGALAGTGASQQSGYSLQQRYDAGYQQCMYAKGHQIPMAGRYAPYRQSTRQAAPPPPPPPPAGTPPPPPPPKPS